MPSDKTYIHTYIFTVPSSAQVGLNVELVMKRAKLQYAIKSISFKITSNY
jgi:pyruvate/2-oxoglutarate dehydrogenase complex dihydrolipoamide dehydrogenase (E3) component